MAKTEGFSEQGGRLAILARKYRRCILLLADTLIFAVAYILAYALRFDGVITRRYWYIIGYSLPLALAIKLAAFHVGGMHRRLMRYTGVHDLILIVKISTVGSLIFVAASALGFRMTGIPRSVFVADWMITVALMCGKSLSLRLLRESVSSPPKKNAALKTARTLIVGAGDAGEHVLRELRNQLTSSHKVVGFLDDAAAKHGLLIHGNPVLGPIAALPEIIEKHRVHQVLIAMPSAPRNTVQEIVDRCVGLNVRIQILPAMADLITGRLSVQLIRDVSIEDLLCRPPVALDMAQVEADLRAKRVLVSGAGGSIGSELARQAAQRKPAALLLLDMAETPLFHIEQELLAHYPDVHIASVIADIRDEQTIEGVFENFRPQRVYHAAAYKHVPLMEAHPCQAILNNIEGTRILAEHASRCGTEKFVMISTDKAVRPSSVMGASKRVCEQMVSSLNGNGTKFAAVRFGNVLGSNGSVIPTFREQIRNGGPLTVTHAEMTRYFMTIAEAVMLVLQCGAMALEKDIFVLDMGEPVRIMDLAENMIRLSGLRVNKDIEILVTGLRPGEKLHEELACYGEAITATRIPKVNVLRNGHKNLSHETLLAAITELIDDARQGKDDAAREKLWALAKECGELAPPDPKGV